MFEHGKTKQKYYSVREKINYYQNILNGKIVNVSNSVKRKAPLRLKTLKKLDSNSYKEPALVVTDDKHFGNPISKPRLCVAYKIDDKKRVLLHPIYSRSIDTIILDNNINRQVIKRYRAVDKNDIYESKYVYDLNGKPEKLSKKDIYKIKNLY